MLPSPVAQYALEKGLPSDLIFSPEKAGDVRFFLLGIINQASLLLGERCDLSCVFLLCVGSVLVYFKGFAT